VNYLFNSSLNSWNNTLVNTIFNASDAVAKLATPLYPRLTLDQRIWKATTDGLYIVKYAYHICSDSLHAATPIHGDARWSCIWSMKIPPRVRAFIWHLANQCFPTRANLINQGIHRKDSCVYCDILAETQMHTFFVC
jgi:hypothetical protein